LAIFEGVEAASLINTKDALSSDARPEVKLRFSHRAALFTGAREVEIAFSGVHESSCDYGRQNSV